MLFGEGGDEFDIFGGLDGAGGVDDATAGLEAREGVFEDRDLDYCEVFDVLGLEAPTDIDTAADDAGVGAGDVEEDGIEGLMESFGGGLAPIVNGDFIDLNVEAGEVFLETGDAFCVGIGAGEAVAGA